MGEYETFNYFLFLKNKIVARIVNSNYTDNKLKFRILKNSGRNWRDLVTK